MARKTVPAGAAYVSGTRDEICFLDGQGRIIMLFCTAASAQARAPLPAAVVTVFSRDGSAIFWFADARGKKL